MGAPAAGRCWHARPRPLRRFLAALPAAAHAAPAAGADHAGTVLDAREALRKRDRNRLAALRAQANAEANPLAIWVDYWELSNRLGEAQQPELDRVLRALARHLRRGPAAQRLAARARPAPRLGQLQRRVPALSHERRPRGHLLCAADRAARRPRHQGRGHAAWMAQRDADDGCALLAATLVDTKQLDRAPTSGRRSRLSADGEQAARGAPGGGRCSARRSRPASARSSTARRAS